MKKLKRLGRHLLDATTCEITYSAKGCDLECVRISGDSDWAGCKTTRRSTSGGCLMVGGHLIKSYSRTQSIVALSSAEAELYGMVEGVTRAKGLRTLAFELGFRSLRNVIKLGTDRSAAKSFVNRRGLGKMRHLQIRNLWLQEEVEHGRLEVHKIKGEENPANLMTKILSLKEVVARLSWINLRAEIHGGELEVERV